MRKIYTFLGVVLAGFLLVPAVSLATTLYNSGAFYTDSSGTVGIGTSTPAEKLEVIGNIKASGIIYASNIPLYINAADGFESYGNGDLDSNNGSHGWAGAWSGSGLFDVQDSVTFNGAKAVELDDNGSEPMITRPLTNTMTQGIVGVAMRRNTDSVDVAQTCFTHGSITEGNRSGCVGLDNNGNIIAQGSVENVIQSYSPDTWYGVYMQFNTDTDTFLVKINNGPWTGPYNFYSAASGIDGVYLRNGNGGGASTTYWDDMTISSY
jgi:hypothetical protein